MARILMVDDDQDLLESGKMILESGGHQVTTALTAPSAEKLIDTQKFDLIFLDIMMESLDDGINLARKLKIKGVKVPIVMMSAVSRVTGYNYGKCDEALPCSGFLEKPVTPKGLLDKVDEVLDK
jgi:CheY-like chemotaxis protein